MVEENKLAYLQRPVPTEESTGLLAAVSLTNAKGLSKQNLIDSGYFEDCLNVDIGRLPVIMPLKIYDYTDEYSLMWKDNEDEITPGEIGEVTIEEFVDTETEEAL